MDLEATGVLGYNHPCYAGLAQLFRARPCQGRGQGLESPDPHHFRITDKKVLDSRDLFILPMDLYLLHWLDSFQAT